MRKFEEIFALFKKHGQEHIFAGWEKLFLDQQDELLEDCRRVDFDWLNARQKELKKAESSPPSTAAAMHPAPVIRLSSSESDASARADARDAGEEKLRQGKAAAFLVAGGQGSRLGFAGPKGCFPVGPLSGRTLFQWHAEQILARSRRYGKPIPWYIMTSAENDRDTRQFFEEQSFFGLPKRDVFFFQQDMVPCLDFEGRLLLASPSRLAMNPNGHGGSLLGLRRSGAFRDMEKRGIEVISYFQVDNPLVVICDPVFLGLHVKSSAEMSSKVVAKNSPAERMGVVCLKDSKPAVAEYIDMTDEEQRALDESGALKFWAGSVAIHMIDANFAEMVAAEGRLPWHQSRKKVTYFSGNRVVRPDTENAVKFETFVFDALPYAERSLNLEVRREDEFAPLKNAQGTDSIETCRQMLSAHFCEWLAKCGISVPVPEMSAGSAVEKPAAEISPLYALDAEELAGKIRPEGLTLEKYLLLG